eukprot:scaffold1089_cov117-Cylindrotheca_fusiformis.AAC.3
MKIPAHHVRTQPTSPILLDCHPGPPSRILQRQSLAPEHTRFEPHLWSYILASEEGWRFLGFLSKFVNTSQPTLDRYGALLANMTTGYNLIVCP